MGELVLLYKISGADFTSTADQAFSKIATFSVAYPMAIIADPTSGKTTGAVGGIYDAASKGGDVYLPSSIAWGLDATATPKKGVQVSSGGTGTQFDGQHWQMTGTLYLSLTTGSSTACSADVYVYGVVIS